MGKRTGYSDFEQFAYDIEGWDVDFKQLSTDPFLSYLQQTESNDLFITSAWFATKLEQRGSAPVDKWTFALLDTGSPEIVWRGQLLSNHIAIYAPDSEIDAYSPPGFNVLTISISSEEVDQWLQLYQHDKPKVLYASGEVLPVDEYTLQKIRTAARQILFATEPSLQREHEETLISQLLNTLLGAGQGLIKISRADHYRKFKNIVGYIDANLGNNILLSDLCRIGEMSPRTVQRLFRYFIDDTPKKYIRTRRLNNVRKELNEKPDTDRYIADIANRWGFWHMGQFASDYYKLFGELPNETLKKN